MFDVLKEKVFPPVAKEYHIDGFLFGWLALLQTVSELLNMARKKYWFCNRTESEPTDEKFNTVLFAILDQSTCLWALLLATLMGVSKISINTVLRKYIGLQHIQRSGS